MSTVLKINKLIRDINSIDDLKAVSATVSSQWRTLQARTMDAFLIGDRVKWIHKGVEQKGTVQSFAKTRLKVKEDKTGVVWLIPGSVLTKMRKSAKREEQTEKEVIKP